MVKEGGGKKGQAERVRVHCRVRPFLNGEDKTSNNIVQQVKENVVGLKGDESFKFDSFLDANVNQGQVYDHVAGPIVASVLEGYNGTIFAYGQTGSGKTHSMFGSEKQNMGIVPRAFHHIFKVINEDEKHDYDVQISYVQLYCELLTDLLSGKNNQENLLIRESNRKGIFIEGCSNINVENAEEAMSYIKQGDQNRVQAATQMNATSSRSHACIIVNISKRKQQTDDGTKETAKKQKVKYGKLILVDLAGSERVKKALGDSYRPARFMESKAINLSLSALGNCISALAKKNKHVPYRDAKLTRLLKDSLGGNSMTALVLNIAPNEDYFSETKSTLLFGQRAMNVETHVSINEEIDFQALYSNVQADLDKRDDRIHELEINLSKIEIELSEARKQASDANREKEMVEMQLKTFQVSPEFSDQILALQMEHSKALERAQAGFEKQVEEEKRKAAHAQEEWNRIEFELANEKEEHLRTCTMLREKQEQLAELEKNKTQRISELFEQSQADKEKLEQVNSHLEVAFSERSQLLEKCKKLEEELQESKEFQERGLKLMQTLTSRVEQLEKKRKEDAQLLLGNGIVDNDQDDLERRNSSIIDRKSSRSHSSKPQRNSKLYGSRRSSSLSKSTSSKSNGSNNRGSTTTSSILRF